MNCKKLYLGQELTADEWSYGIGSVYLCGPRNSKGKSWRLDLISKLEEAGSPISLFIPETKNQLKGGFNKQPQDKVFQWNRVAMSVSTAILFWFPKNATDAQSFVEFGSWHKSERIFLGRELGAKTEYLDWLLYKEQLLYPADSLDQLVEMVIHWLKE